MRISVPREFFRILLLSAFLLVASYSTFAQAPGSTPTPNPAAEPPNTVRPNPGVPQTQRNNPTAPPQSQPGRPTAPPGTQNVPPPTTQQPVTSPTVEPTPPVDDTVIQEPANPNFPPVEQRPLPPIPNMTRLGVTSDNTLTLTLNEA